MSSSSYDGGPAFACSSVPGADPGSMGMTLRQYYKAAAVIGLGANTSYTSGAVGKGAHQFAEDAAKIADAMLAEDEEHAEK